MTARLCPSINQLDAHVQLVNQDNFSHKLSSTIQPPWSESVVSGDSAFKPFQGLSCSEILNTGFYIRTGAWMSMFPGIGMLSVASQSRALHRPSLIWVHLLGLQELSLQTLLEVWEGSMSMHKPCKVTCAPFLWSELVLVLMEGNA